MNIEEVMKKLTEIKVDAYNNLSSSEKESQLQLESATKELNEDMAAGEEVKIKRTKGEKVKEIPTLSRAMPMDGGKGADEKVYLNDGTLKAPSIESLQAQLDDLKKDSSVEGRARSILEEGPKNANEANTFRQIEMELASGNTAALEQLLENLPQGGPITKEEGNSWDDDSKEAAKYIDVLSNMTVLFQGYDDSAEELIDKLVIKLQLLIGEADANWVEYNRE